MSDHGVELFFMYKLSRFKHSNWESFIASSTLSFTTFSRFQLTRSSSKWESFLHAKTSHEICYLPFIQGLHAHLVASGRRTITVFPPHPGTLNSLMTDSSGEQHEQLVAIPTPWLKGLAEDKQPPRQPEVVIVVVLHIPHLLLFKWMRAFCTWHGPSLQ